MKIENFTFDTSKQNEWTSWEEIYEVINTLRQKKYIRMSAYLAMTPKNAAMVQDLVKIAVLSVFEYNYNFYFNMALTTGLPIAESFYNPRAFLRELTKALLENLKTHECFYRDAANAHVFTVNKKMLDKQIKGKYLIYGVKFPEKKKTVVKAKEQKKAA